MYLHPQTESVVGLLLGWCLEEKYDSFRVSSFHDIHFTFKLNTFGKWRMVLFLSDSRVLQKFDQESNQQTQLEQTLVQIDVLVNFTSR